MWGQVASADGFHIMALDVPSSRPWSEGDSPFFVSVRGEDTDEIAAYWERLSVKGRVVQPLAPAGWAPLDGMLTDQFGVWVVDVAVDHAPS
ncbi:MAG TPA: VOC family protein [Mycobacteriales bacterium]